MHPSLVLADAAIWINYFRKSRHSANDKFQKLLLAEQIRLCGVVLAEVLQGAKTQEEFELILTLIRAIPYLEESQEDWESAARLVFKLRKKGITLTLSDCLIATIAQRFNCFVFSLDKDFSKIPDLKLFASP